MRALSAMTPRGESAHARVEDGAVAEDDDDGDDDGGGATDESAEQRSRCWRSTGASAPGSTSPVRLRRERNAARRTQVLSQPTEPGGVVEFLENEEATGRGRGGDGGGWETERERGESKRREFAQIV